MDPKKREQVILVLLPAAIVLLGYTLFFYRVQTKETRLAREKLEKLSAKAVSQQAVSLASTRVRFLERETGKIEDQLQSAKVRIDEICSGFGTSQQQFGVVERTTELLRKNRVMLLAQSTTSEPRLSRHQKEVLKTIRDQSGSELEFRELRLEGRYGDVLAFLRQLGESQIPSLPVALELDTSKSVNGIHGWRIVIVM